MHSSDDLGVRCVRSCYVFTLIPFHMKKRMPPEALDGRASKSDTPKRTDVRQSTHTSSNAHSNFQEQERKKVEMRLTGKDLILQMRTFCSGT